MTAFEELVLKTLSQVPAGYLTTYSALARAVGKPQAARAVGNALHKNPWAPQVPCHRVLKADGSLGGYAGGSRRKQALLKAEGWRVVNGKVENFRQRLWLWSI